MSLFCPLFKWPFGSVWDFRFTITSLQHSEGTIPLSFGICCCWWDAYCQVNYWTFVDKLSFLSGGFYDFIIILVILHFGDKVSRCSFVFKDILRGSLGLLNLEIHVLFLERTESLFPVSFSGSNNIYARVSHSILSHFFHMSNCFIVLCFILEDLFSSSF